MICSYENCSISKLYLIFNIIRAVGDRTILGIDRFFKKQKMITNASWIKCAQNLLFIIYYLRLFGLSGSIFIS